MQIACNFIVNEIRPTELSDIAENFNCTPGRNSLFGRKDLLVAVVYSIEKQFRNLHDDLARLQLIRIENYIVGNNPFKD